MQLQVFTGCGDAKPVIRAVEASRIEGAVYHDVNDPRGIGILGISEDPTFFASAFRDLLNTEPFAALTHRPQFTMLGRTRSEERRVGKECRGRAGRSRAAEKGID